KWFWLLEGAYFIDAGNIWTLRNYDNQPGGQFHWDHFYEEIACSVGMGIRLNFNFFLIRIDGGMKVYDPSGLTSDERWRIKHIDSWNDFAAHIAIGYPF
ncbi:MAG: BamA/TamA family outer membrane protein, partial [Bacteroidales bacterium]|nr:BamA/TamA family outer membrane protein [Bacteroidales bacterium]